jgi:hypothetical protein
MPGAGPMAGLPELSDQSGQSGMNSGGMSEEEARAIVEAAAKDGKISSDEAQGLLKEPTGASKLWKKFSGK